MSMLTRALQRELVDFIGKLQQESVDIAQVSKAAFCKARKKLKPIAFVKLSQSILDIYYGEADNPQRQLWKGVFRLLATDGSTAEVPNSEEVQQKWGVFKYRDDGKAVCMSRLSQVFDVLNHLTISSRIDSFNISESALFWGQLKTTPAKEGDLYLLDRYYASFLLIFYLQARGANFCFRMKKDWWKVVEKFYNSGQQSQIVALELPRKDRKMAGELGIKSRQVTCRLVKVPLDSGETEILLTSLTDETAYTIEDMKELYGLRWGIETHYCALKQKAELENFSGKSIKAIEQDYYAKMFILTYTAVLVQPVNQLLEQAPKKKHVHKVNFIEAMARMKKAIVDIFIFKRISQTLEKLFDWFAAFTEPVRKNRKFKRPKLPKNKKHRNYVSA